ncbi:MAG: Ca-activated chloride channel family protein, partial [Pseudoalteromonas tetraodonis]
FEGLLEGKVKSVTETLHYTSAEHADFTPDKPLRISIRKPAERGVQVLTFTEPKGKLPPTYFHATVPVESVAREARLPKKVCVLWDASASSDSGREYSLATLGSYFAKLGEAEVSVVAFRDQAAAPKQFHLDGTDVSEVIGYLLEIPADGGTRFGALNLEKYPADVFVLVSDGLATFGTGEIDLAGKPVVVLNGSKSADHGYLRSIARTSGGRYINLTVVKPTVAVALMTGERFTFLGVDGGEGLVDEVFPGKGAPVAAGGFELAGRLNGEEVELTLMFGFGDEVTTRKKVVVRRENPGQSQRARRLWAQAKVAELGLRFDENRDEIVTVAKKNSIVTRATSLIVLDTLDDYVTHRVIPPQEMREEFFERIEVAELESEKPMRERLDAVVASFEEKKKWYAMKYPGIEMAILESAKFEVHRAKALLKKTGRLQILKRKKLKEGTLAPAENLLVEAKALEAALKVLEHGDAAEQAAWRDQAAKLAVNIGAFSAQQDKTYPEFTRGESSGDGGGDPFSSGGGNDDPFGGGGGGGGGALRSGSRAGGGAALYEAAPSESMPARPQSSSRGFPVTPANPTGYGDFASPEIPPSFGAFGSGATVGSIRLKKWDPKAPYLKALKRTKGDNAYPLYLKFRKKNSDSSAFFLDVADFFIERERHDLALRVLSNIAEMDLENAPLLRILGHRLLQLGEAESAVAVFEEVLQIRGEEPQSYRDLAMAKQAVGDMQRAAELLWEVVKGSWDDRFSDIELIALGELNALIAIGGKGLIPQGMDSRLLSPMPVDLRVVLTWDADNTDMDLWVVDPTGEVCKYSHNRTITGGRMSDDFTGGYGPEEFLIKRALPGKYLVKAHFYGNHQQTLAGATTIQAKITTAFGQSSEKTESVTLRLNGEDEVIEIGAVEAGMTK